LNKLEIGKEHLINAYHVLESTHQDFKELLKELRDYIDQITMEIETKKQKVIK